MVQITKHKATLVYLLLQNELTKPPQPYLEEIYKELSTELEQQLSKPLDEAETEDNTEHETVKKENNLRTSLEKKVITLKGRIIELNHYLDKHSYNKNYELALKTSVQIKVHEVFLMELEDILKEN